MAGLEFESLDDEDGAQSEDTAKPTGGIHMESLDDAVEGSEQPVRTAGNARGEGIVDALAPLAEGLTLNNAGEVGNARLDTLLAAFPALRAGARALGVGDKDVGTAIADLVQPSRARDGMEPTYAGRRGVDAQELVDRGMETGTGKAAYLAGLAAPAIASGFAAPAAVGTQAAVGAVQGGLAAGGENDYDPLATLVGAGTGGALAGLGGAAAQKATAPATAGGSRADALMRFLGDESKRLGSQMLGGAGLGAVVYGMNDPAKAVEGAAKGAGGALALRVAGSLLPKAAPYVAPSLRAAGQAAAPVGGMATGRTSKASAQADVAYGTAPTMAWAVESVLTSGDTGLEPTDEQQLTEAVMSGDEDRVIAANYSLSQRSPGYAARLRRELAALQEE